MEKLAASVGFPLKKLFVIDGSRRSAHSNAFMVRGAGCGKCCAPGLGGGRRRACKDTHRLETGPDSKLADSGFAPSPRCTPPPHQFGFGQNKRICLFDTLLEQLREEQVRARWPAAGDERGGLRMAA